MRADVCRLCGRGERRLNGGYCQACGFYVAEQLGKAGHFQNPLLYLPNQSPIIRHHGPICYLCGENPGEVAEHVFPRAKGGSDTWANLGSACGACNLRKGDRILDPTDEQRERLARQQAAVQESLDALFANKRQFWLDWFTGDVENAVGYLKDEYLEDPEWVDREAVGDAVGLDGMQEDYPLLSDTTLDVVHDQVLKELHQLDE